MSCDLHLHSSHSDGRLSPAELIGAIADTGITLAALTDHDTTGGHAEASEAARQRGITFVPGIEMTTFAYGQVVHVLGLGIDGKHNGLQTANERALAVWDRNQLRWISQLTAAGLPISVPDDFADHPVRLPVLIERLCRKGVAGGEPSACLQLFRAFALESPAAAYDGLLSPSQAGDVIRDAGGVAILAHPYALKGDNLIDALLKDCDGLEAQYSAYPSEKQESLMAKARRAGKLYSCGSDFHGYFTENYVHPNFAAPEELIRRIAR